MTGLSLSLGLGLSPRGGGAPALPQEPGVSAAKFVGSGAASSYLAADLAWTAPENITADDASYATATSTGSNQTTQVLTGTMGTNPHAIPAGSRIDSLTFKIKGKTSSGTAPTAFRNVGFWPVVGGAIAGRDLFNASTGFGSTEAELTFTLTPAQLGFQPTPEMVNAGTFGMAAQFSRAGGSGVSAQVNAESIAVSYTTNVYGDANLPGCLSVFTLPSDRTSSTSYDVVTPNVLPKALLFFQGYTRDANITNGTGTTSTGTGQQALRTRTTDLNYCAAMYSADSAAMYAVHCTASDGAMTCARYQRNDRIGIGLNIGHVVAASSVAQDKLTVGWSGTADNSKPMLAAALNASASHLSNHDDANPGATPFVDVTTGFLPQVIINISGQEALNSGSHSGGHTGQSIGFAKWNGASYDQYCVMIQNFYQGWDGAGPLPEGPLPDVLCKGVVRSDRIHQSGDNGVSFNPTPSNFYATVSNASSTGYRVNFSGDNAATPGDGFALLALSMPSAQIAAGTFKLARSTGTQDLFTPTQPIGFTPKLVILIPTLIQALDAEVYDSAQAAMFAAAVIDRGRSASTGYTNENGAVSNVSTWMDLENVRLFNGDQTTAFVASSASMKAGGVSANVTTAAAADCYGIFLALA